MTKCFYYIFFIRAAIICGCFFMGGCKNDYRKMQDMGTKKVAVDEAINVESYLSDDGKVKAKLTAPLMTSTQTDSPKTEFPKTLHVDFYDTSTKVETKLFAKYGLYYQSKKLMFLKDSVIVINVKGDTLRTEELWWDENKEIIYTNVAVHIRKPDEKLDGTGFIADQNLKKWTIYNAKGPINVADSTLPTY